MISIIGLGLSQIPLDPRTSEHDPRASPVESVLRGEDTDSGCPLSPETIVRDQVLDLVQTFRELGDEVVDVIHQTDWKVLKTNYSHNPYKVGI